jgi:hypothetical protein
MPLDDWAFALSPNAVVSILGAVSRASLAFAISAAMSQEKWTWFRRSARPLIDFDRFDEASKGPWGSIRLAWWVNIRWVLLKNACVTCESHSQPVPQTLGHHRRAGYRGVGWIRAAPPVHRLV